MTKQQKTIFAVLLCFSLLSCSATQTSVNSNLEKVSNTEQKVYSVITPKVVSTATNQSITLERIMSDPDWLGRQPQSPGWSLDSQQVTYLRKREGSVIQDSYLADPKVSSNGQQVSFDALHTLRRSQEVVSNDARFRAWVFLDNIFVHDHQLKTTKQLTRDAVTSRDLAFLADNRLAYRVYNSFYALDIETGKRELLVSWRYADKPEAVTPPNDFIAKEQIELIDYVALKRKQRQQLSDYSKQIKSNNPTASPASIYLPKGMENVAVALSPNADYLIVVGTEDKPNRQDSDIMPNYIQEDGRIAAESVRSRVADAKPESDKVWLVDIGAGSSHEISFKSLPGYNDDVLADVKRENAVARGEDYQVNRLPRDIRLLRSSQSVQWHSSGDVVALMLEAWDNKDRWIVSLALDDKKFVTQHRLSDEAWINYRHNGFGWLKRSKTLFYLSEETGYSQLYVKPLNGAPKAVTQGEYVVDSVTISNDDTTAYFKANIKHPGIYEIYRANLESDEVTAITDLNGMTDYVLSPDESTLLLTHSKLTMPPELYSVASDAQGSVTPVKVTSTVSDEFLAQAWVAPSIVPVPSSHTDKPIYSRVYLPQGNTQSKRKAVVFNHGAGYLQNAHMGWSGYFREFMFHSLLVQQGYVVMDMDYRASAGYGRDWRTAIYRQMGTPETQDLVDGVEWLVENADVDRERIGTYGGSYGGFMTFMALFTEPELFQAGAALRPVSDWAHYNHGYTSNILNTPDVDPIAYRRSSPIYFAEGLQKPLLINAPMIDNNVFFVDVVRLVQRLIELEKENFETAIYPVEPHGFVQPSSWLDEYRRIFKLFEDNL